MTTTDADSNLVPAGARRGIVVVGHCASGKSTLVDSLRERGYDAYVAAQEHSEIANLWAHQDPEVVIALSVSAEGVRLRRTRSWPDWLHETQSRRLKSAFAAADLLLGTDELEPEEVLRSVLAYLDSSRHT